MPNFVGCRCCRRARIVVMCDGDIFFYSGGGTQIATYSDANANHDSWVKFLSKNRIAWMNSSSTGSKVFINSLSGAESSVSKWFTGTSAGTGPYLENTLCLGADQQFGAISTLGENSGSDKDAKVAEYDASVTGTLVYDNKTYNLSIHYSQGLYRVNSSEIGGPPTTSETFMYVFQPDGTAVRDYSLNTKLGMGTSGAEGLFVHQLGLPTGTVVSYLNTGRKYSLLDGNDDIVWTASGSSFGRLFACSDGNFFATDGTGIHANRLYKYSSSDGSLLGTYDLLEAPKSSGGRDYRPTLVSDPLNADNVYYVGTSGDLIKENLSTASLIWSEGFTGYTTGAIDAIAF